MAGKRFRDVRGGRLWLPVPRLRSGASDAAMVYAIAKGRRGLLVEVDVSGMNGSKCAGVGYGARNDIGVTKGGRRVYNPYGRFGGGQSGMISVEAEVHLPVGSTAITSVVIAGKRQAGFMRLEAAVSRLGRIQKREITIKYLPDQEHA